MNFKNVILRTTFAVASVGIMINQSFGDPEQIKINSEASLQGVLKNPYGPCSVTVSTEARVKVDDLVEVLQGLTQIKELNLRHCRFYIEGAKKISKWLSQNQSLEKLDLAFNDIEDEGAMALAGALRENGTLKTLIVNGNFINDEGASALRDVLKEKNTTLQELDLGGFINKYCARD